MRSETETAEVRAAKGCPSRLGSKARHSFCASLDKRSVITNHRRDTEYTYMNSTVDVKSLSSNERFEVPVIQFLMPNGQRRDTSTHLPSSCRDAVDSMHEAGCRFEAEMLQTGEISVTISDPKEEIDVDISVTGNGPEVQTGMIAMLERRSWEVNSVPSPSESATASSKQNP